MTEITFPDPTAAASVPLEQIPVLLARLAAVQSVLLARLVAEPRQAKPDAQSERLLTAAQMAERLSIPETKVRSDARAGKIPFVRAGERYMRFNPSAVLAAYNASTKRR